MTRRKKITWASAAGAVVLLAMASVVFVTLGSGESASSAPASSQAPVQSVAPTSVKATTAQALPSASLHDRVMAEQGRGAGTSAADRQSTTTTASPPPSETTPAGTTPAGTTYAETTEPGTPTGDAETATAAVSLEGQTPLRGIWSGTAEQLAAYLLGICPEPRFTVSTLALAEYYVYYCADAGLRADLLWAQMIQETGYGRYGGDVSPDQNNYAGLGATGGGEPGIHFVTAEAGVMAHVAHMVAYVYTSSPVEWANAATDPRFDLVSPRGATAVLADLNGRWAVPGTTYGESIEAIARAINGG